MEHLQLVAQLIALCRKLVPLTLNNASGGNQDVNLLLGREQGCSVLLRQLLYFALDERFGFVLNILQRKHEDLQQHKGREKGSTCNSAACFCAA
jgi:hypothetical protein